MKIYCDDSYAGNGKTTRAINRMVSIQNQVITRLKPASTKVIYCCERRETYPAIIKQINAASILAGTSPDIIQVRSGKSKRATRSVRKRIEALADEPVSDHTIVLITHAALMMADFSGFEGWSLVIDEVPSLLSVNHLRTDTSVKILRDLYDLKSRGDGWSEITLSAEGRSKSNADIMGDDLTKLGKFHAAARAAHDGAGRMVARLESWDVTAEKWFSASWFSFWNLSSFAHITVLGNQFTESVDVKLVRHYDELIAETRGETIEWISLSEPAQSIRPRTRNVNIRYFDHAHASASKFQEPEGKRNLEKVAKYLSSALPPTAIWSANNGDLYDVSVIDVMSPFMMIDALSPRQAGSNEHRASHAAAIIYTANASSDCQTFLKLSGQSADDWRLSKEHETILQFLTRTSIRDTDSNHDVELYVYDKFDADYVENYFKEIGHITHVEFVDLDLEFQGDSRKDNGRKPSPLTIDDQFLNVFKEHRGVGKTAFTSREIMKGESGKKRLSPAFPRRNADEVKRVLGRLIENGLLTEKSVIAGNGRKTSEYHFTA